MGDTEESGCIPAKPGGWLLAGSGNVGDIVGEHSNAVVQNWR